MEPNYTSLQEAHDVPHATIITDDDGQEIVSAIGEFEGTAPQPRLGRVEQVAPGAKIGMVRDAVGGFDRFRNFFSENG
ncbi:MAG: hypothetical protein EOS17_11420 [Mesorhizobium sp.]|nr:MAG: hypothetical protein EOS17_11420 [Mesorhizobium sp.]